MSPDDLVRKHLGPLDFAGFCFQLCDTKASERMSNRPEVVVIRGFPEDLAVFSEGSWMCLYGEVAFQPLLRRLYEKYKDDLLTIATSLLPARVLHAIEQIVSWPHVFQPKLGKDSKVFDINFTTPVNVRSVAPLRIDTSLLQPM